MLFKGNAGKGFLAFEEKNQYIEDIASTGYKDYFLNAFL